MEAYGCECDLLEFRKTYRLAPFKWAVPMNKAVSVTTGRNLAHSVTISKEFFMMQSEVTQALYELVMGTNPSRHQWASQPGRAGDLV